MAIKLILTVLALLVAAFSKNTLLIIAMFVFIGALWSKVFEVEEDNDRDF